MVGTARGVTTLGTLIWIGIGGPPTVSVHARQENRRTDAANDLSPPVPEGCRTPGSGLPTIDPTVTAQRLPIQSTVVKREAVHMHVLSPSRTLACRAVPTAANFVIDLRGRHVLTEVTPLFPIRKVNSIGPCPCPARPARAQETGTGAKPPSSVNETTVMFPAGRLRGDPSMIRSKGYPRNWRKRERNQALVAGIALMESNAARLAFDRGDVTSRSLNQFGRYQGQGQPSVLGRGGIRGADCKPASRYNLATR